MPGSILLPPESKLKQPTGENMSTKEVRDYDNALVERVNNRNQHVKWAAKTVQRNVLSFVARMPDDVIEKLSQLEQDRVQLQAALLKNQHESYRVLSEFMG